MPYSPTAWINDVPPPMSAANLNKLTNELKSQATAKGVSNTLPTWADGTTPAISDPAPLNEMERVAAAVAATLSLGYVPTSWLAGWTPPRNQIRLNRLEAQAQANRAAIDAGGGPITWEGPATFSDANVAVGGATITGRNFQSTSTTPAVSILTARPLLFQDCRFRNITANTALSYMVDAYHGTAFGADIRFNNCHIYGGATVDASNRWLVATNFKRLEVTNCTIDNTRGIELWEGTYAGATCALLRNKQTNIKGGASTKNDKAWVSNFVQMRVMRNTAFEIGWNEIINEYNLSEPEDIISIYHTANVHMYDNYLQHQSMPLNIPGSISGVTADASDPGLSIDNCTIERNQLVDGMGINMSCQNGGNNNIIRDNRIIADNLLPNGQVKANGYSGLATRGGSNYTVTGNLVGYYGTSGRVDFDFIGSTGNFSNNTSFSGTLNAAAEAAELTFWNNKKTANGITVGSTLP